MVPDISGKPHMLDHTRSCSIYQSYGFPCRNRHGRTKLGAVTALRTTCAYTGWILCGKCKRFGVLDHLKLLLTTLSRFSIHYKFTIAFISHEVTELQNHSVCAFSFSSRIISFLAFSTHAKSETPAKSSTYTFLRNKSYMAASFYTDAQKTILFSYQHLLSLKSKSICANLIWPKSSGK